MSGAGPDGSEEPADRVRRLFEATQRPLLLYALRRAPTASDAEDAAAETYAIAWRRLSHLPVGEGELPWLYGICRRVLANQRRGGQRRQRLLERLGSAPTAAAPETGDATGPAMQALSRLRPDDQEILRLVAWEDLSHEDIATALGITRNAVAIRLHRARQRLLAALQESQGGSRSLLGRMRVGMNLKGIGRSRTSAGSKAALDDSPGLESST